MSAVSECDLDLWKLCHDCITQSEDVVKHFAALPCDSYHMTTTMLENEKMIKNELWQSYVSNRLSYYQEIHQALESLDLRPVFRVNKVDVEGVIFVMGSIDDDSRDKIMNFAEQFSLSNFLPFDWHITLAYNFKPFSSQQQFNTISELVKQILEQHLIGKEFTLDVAKLCWYNDMTAFMPWTPTSYPFQDSAVQDNMS